MSDLIYGAGAIGFLQGSAMAGRQLPGIDFFIIVGAIALAIGFVGILSIYAAICQLGARLEVSRRGVNVEGRVTGRRFDRRSRWWMVTYSYDYQGEAYSHEQAVRKKVYLALDEGAGVFVRCLARDPRVARVVDPGRMRVIYDPDEFWHNIAFKFYGGVAAIVVVLVIVQQVVGVLM